MHRHIVISGLLIFVFACFSCAGNKSGVLLYDVSFENGKIYLANFSQDTKIRINDVEYVFGQNTPVFFNSNSSISTAYLAYNQVIKINDMEFPLKAVKVNGIGNYNIAFHENGMPRLFWLSENITMQVGSSKYTFRGAQTSVPLILDGFSKSETLLMEPLETLELYDDGNLSAGYLNETTNFNGTVIPAGTRVIFGKDGALEKYYDAEQDEYVTALP